jgi:hypothetical protein
MVRAKDPAILDNMAGATRFDPLLVALQAHGTEIRTVRYRQNRSVLVSVSRDGSTLNAHACFRLAPRAVAEAVAQFVASPRRSARYRRVLGVIQGWEGARLGLEEARRTRPPRGTAPGRTEAVRTLRDLFDRFNEEHFDGRLPHVHLRVSGRMTRSLGTIAYSERAGARSVRQISISGDLLLPGNRAILVDTVLHEMAHAEAWLEHGHRGHGVIWRRVALRVGCAPRAITDVRVRRERR